MKLLIYASSQHTEAATCKKMPYILTKCTSKVSEILTFLSEVQISVSIASVFTPFLNSQHSFFPQPNQPSKYLTLGSAALAAKNLRKQQSL